MATIVHYKNGTEVTFRDGASIVVSSEAGSASLPNWHEYQSTYVVNKVGSAFTTDSVWASLLNSPAPGSLLGSGPARTGSTTNKFGPGAVSHIVDHDDRIVVNLTLGSTDSFYEHPLYPGAVVRHVSIIDGYIVVESVGIGNFASVGALSAAVNNLMGEFFFGGPGANTLELMTQPRCFPAATSVTMADGTRRAIKGIIVGDVVMAYNATPGFVSRRAGGM
jgi:hypothetical protein